MSLTAQAFTAAALALGCDVATIRAVDEVESAGAGFDAAGRPKILFEPHIFSAETRGHFDKSHPGLSYPQWRPGNASYRGDQHAILQAARALDNDAAIKACSWGRYQILGRNWRLTGARSLAHFEQLMRAGEGEHLAAFVAFVKAHRSMWEALRRRDWAGFASAYNGPRYAENDYHIKLAKAYLKHSKGN